MVNCCNVKFHECLSGGSQIVWYGQTDIMKLVVTFHSFTIVPNK
jgi:hypothetical protein